MQSQWPSTTHQFSETRLVETRILALTQMTNNNSLEKYQDN